jgi:HEAT repeat protein
VNATGPAPTPRGDYLGRPAAHWAALLDSDDPLTRRLGAYALGECGPGASSFAGKLAATLRDPVSFVRVWGAAALVQADVARPQAVGALLDATGDEQYFVRSLAAWLLGRLGADVPDVEASTAALRRLADDDDDASVRAEAAVALDRLGSATRRG